MTVHTQPEYRITAMGPAPAGYPDHVVPDTFAEEPFAPDFESRRQAFFAHLLRNPAPENAKPAWVELARAVAGAAPHEGILGASLEFIDARRDCADFVLHGILRLLHPWPSLPSHVSGRPPYPLRDALRARAARTVLGFKYFPDEPGIDSLCTWTENHYILFTSAAYLAGQLFPDEVFGNSGETGREKIARNRPRILRWMHLRFRTGFSEWLSHVYYDEDLTALLALHDFAADEEIRRKAAILLDLLLLDIALNSFRGVFGATHGRAYENTKKWAAHEGTTDTSKLLFGTGVFSLFDNMSAIAFALSSYRVPPAIEAIAVGAGRAATDSYVNRQRMGIRIAELERWGLRPDNFEDGMLYLTLEAYLHPRTIANTLRMFDICNWWDNAFLSDFKPHRRWLRILDRFGGLPLLARAFERDVCRNTREEVNVYTFRTADYMLSTAQDYRKGYGGDQQHIWQATLGPDAVCFTTHPAKIDGVTPNYWAGSGVLPRAAQHRNVVVAIYRIRRMPALYVPVRHFYTHAWLPRDRFDQIEERDGWVFARKGRGYLGLRSWQPAFWHIDGSNPSPGIELRQSQEDIGRELVAPGADNVWVCQLGREAEDGSFSEFADKLSAAELRCDGLDVTFDSPGNGRVTFGWERPFCVDGVEVRLRDYPRYDNPFVQAEFDPQRVSVAAAGHELVLDWASARREFGALK